MPIDRDSLKYKTNLLHVAVKYNDLSTVAAFLKNSDLETRKALIKNYDYYPFRWACEYGFLDIVRCIFESAEMEDKEWMLMTSDCEGMRWACQRKHTKVIHYLLSQAIRLDVVIYKALCNKLPNQRQFAEIRQSVEIKFKHDRALVESDISNAIASTHQIPLGKIVALFMFGPLVPEPANQHAQASLTNK